MLTEVHYFQGFAKKDWLRVGGAIVSIVLILTVVLELLPAFPQIPFLEGMKGILFVINAAYFVIEGMR